MPQEIEVFNGFMDDSKARAFADLQITKAVALIQNHEIETKPQFRKLTSQLWKFEKRQANLLLAMATERGVIEGFGRGHAHIRVRQELPTAADGGSQ